MVDVPVRLGNEPVALVEIFCVPRLVRFAVTDWLPKFAMIWALPWSAYTVLPLVAPPTPMVIPLNVAVPVAGTEAAGVRLPNANVPARPAVAVSLTAQTP